MQIAIGFEKNLDESISDAFNGRGPWPLTLKQILVLRRLCDHRGRKTPICLRDLTAATALSDREIKAMMRSFVMDFGIPVGASRGKPEGYYLCTSPEERMEAARPYLNEIRNLSMRVKALVGGRIFLEELGQKRLEDLLQPTGEGETPPV